MIDKKERRSTDLGPYDLASSYTESTYNQSSVSSNKLASNDPFGNGSRLDLPVFHPGVLGGRTSPGDGGFAYADSPQATVFVQKKEWIEGEWNYVSYSTDERLGKNQEILTRIALGNLITRKLNLLNDHELFTKFNQLNSDLAEFQSNNLSLASSQQNLSPKLLADLLTLSGSPVTKYYTETIKVTDPRYEEVSSETTRTVQESNFIDEPIKEKLQIEIADSIRVITVEDGLAGRLRIRSSPSFGNNVIGFLAKGAIVQTTKGKEENGSVWNVVSVAPKLKEHPSRFPTLENPGAKGLWWQIDLTKIASNQLILTGEDPTKALEKLRNYRVGYVARTAANSSVPVTEASARSFFQNQDGSAVEVQVGTQKREIKTTKEIKELVQTKEAKEGKSIVVQNSFNGVIELANIQDIRTTISNSGQTGTASFTLENPMNLLVVSEEDIEIALGQISVDDESVALENENGSIVERKDLVTGENRTLRYYNGSYYTERAYRLITKQSLSAVGNSLDINPTARKLKEEQTLLLKHQENLGIYLGSGTIFDSSRIPSISESLNFVLPEFSLDEISETLPRVSEVVVSGRPEGNLDPNYQDSRIQESGRRKLEQIKIRYSTNLAAYDLLVKGGLQDLEDTTLDYRRSQLRKYFQNRTIFGVYDRVYVWMSSPSRTSFKLDDGTVVSEASNRAGSEQKFFQKIQEIIGLMKQIDRALQFLASQAGIVVEQIFTNQILTLINEELFASFESKIYNKIKDRLVGETDPLVSSLKSAIDFKLEDFKNFAESTKFPKIQSDNLSDFVLNSSSPTGVRNALEGNDPRDLLREDSFAGLEETQIQVFQGVITGISRNYSDGRFSISIECEDNSNFLERSRYTERPALQTNFRQLRTELDDPIFRKVRNKESIEKAKQEQKIDNLTGRWKTGILTVCGLYQPVKDQDQSANSLSKGEDRKEEGPVPDIEMRLAAKPYSFPFNQPFKGADPATIISLLVTGTPFDPQTYLLNSRYTGSIASTPSDEKGRAKDGEIVLAGPLENVRQQVLGQVRKYGDFEPYIARSGRNLTLEERRNVNQVTLLNVGVSVVNFVMTYVKSRPQLFPALDQRIIKERESKQDQNAIYKEINLQNITTLFDYDEDKFPKSRQEIKLKKGSLGDARVEFLVQAAINGVKIGDLNGLLTNLTKPDNSSNGESKKFQSFVPEVTSDIVRKFYDAGQNYSLNENDSRQFVELDSAVESRIKRSTFINILYNQDEKSTEILDFFKRVDDQELSTNQASLGFADYQKVAKLRGVIVDDEGRVVSGNPLQATKASIVFKQKPNYLAISEEYFKSPNLVDYVEQVLTSPGDLMIDQYKTVKQRCQESARTLQWEFYADSQGHIRFKQPTYNRTLLKHLLDLSKIELFAKSSFGDLLKENNLDLVYKLALLRSFQAYGNRLGLQLQALVKNQIDIAKNYPILKEAIDAIYGNRLFNSSTNKRLADLFSKEGLGRGRLAEIEKILNFGSLTFFNLDTKEKLPSGEDPSSLAIGLVSELETKTGNLEKLIQEANPENLEQSTKIKQILEETKSVFDSAILEYENQTRANLETGTGLKILIEKAIKSIEKGLSGLKFFAILNQKIQEKISSLESTTTNSLSDITDQNFIHVITSAILISESYSENPPDFTRLNIYATQPLIGVFNDLVPSETLQWAGSVDYDLWRIYGHKESERMEIPFLRTAGQAVIYAHQLMAREYGKILRGSMTVRGDSKYQPGDTVYIEDENIYYYIESVNHNFTYGGTFTTTLTLGYGRRPGYFIPYPFDVLGDRMLSNITKIYQFEPTDIRTVIDKARESQASLEGGGDN